MAYQLYFANLNFCGLCPILIFAVELKSKQMKFRTEIDIPKSSFGISHDDRIVMLGSCFTDNIGEKLEREGFIVTHNPMGPLYNPLSIQEALQRAIFQIPYSLGDLVQDAQGQWHCLDFASRYSNSDAEALVAVVNAEIMSLAEALSHATTVIVTLGTAWHFRYQHDGRPRIAGNCHKLPAAFFERRRMSVEGVSATVSTILGMLGTDRKVIFTISPIRHLADGLHGNELSKATLMLGVEASIGCADYFL